MIHKLLNLIPRIKAKKLEEDRKIREDSGPLIAALGNTVAEFMKHRENTPHTLNVILTSFIFILVRVIVSCRNPELIFKHFKKILGMAYESGIIEERNKK